MVWFHGGSLARFSKDDVFTQQFAKHFAQKGVGMAVVNYRLSPKVKYPVYIEDAADSVVWVINHIQEYGGNPVGIFISGHSAGGYLAYMLVMDKKYLKLFGEKGEKIAGIIPVSGQTFTHYTIRKERGIPNPETTPVIDEASPCFNAHNSTPPILAIYGDMDPADRIKENQYLIALLKKVGHPDAEYREMKNRNHWGLVLMIKKPDDPVSITVLEFIKKHTARNKT